MKMFKILLILGLSLGTSIAQDCWQTGCQPNDWATKGCDQYGRQEKGRERCWDNRGVEGNKYTCCTGGSSGGSSGDGGGGTGGGFVSFDQFKKGVTNNGYPEPSQEQYNNFNNNARSQGRINSVQEAAMCLAQLLHESDGLRAKREYACQQPGNINCPNNYNNQGCEVPGQYYYGRGYIQLSWCYNYRDASQAIFGDQQRLLNNPDSVAQDDSLAWKTAFWFWSKNVHDAAGVQQGRFGASTKAINGGLECSAPGNQQAQKRYEMYGKVRAAFGLSGPGDASGCA